MKKVISIVLINFTNDNRVLKENLTLLNNGYNPTIVAFNEGNLPEKENISGLEVRRIRILTNTWNTSTPVKILNYLFFIFKFLITFNKADIYHCNDLNGLLVGLLAKFFFCNKAKIVYDAHEYEIETSGMGKYKRLFAHLLEGILIKHADLVVTVSDSIANEYIRLYDIKKPTLVLNCPAYKPIIKHDLFREELGIRKDQKIYIYQGALSKDRGLDKLLDYFSSLKDNSKVIIFMGYGSMEKEIRECKSPNVYFHKAVSGSDLLKYTSSADYGVFVYENHCKNIYYCLPNKLFEFMHAGLPVIVANLYELSRFVKNNEIGVVAESTSKESMEKAILEIEKLDYQKMSQNALNLAKEYCWENQEKELIKAYKSI